MEKVGSVHHVPKTLHNGEGILPFASPGRRESRLAFLAAPVKECQDSILSRSSDTTMLNINVDDIGSLPIRQPEPEELEKILALHAEMAQKATTISMAMWENGQAMKKMAVLIN